MNKVEYLSNKILIPSNSQPFKIISDFEPAGDQHQAIKKLIKKAKNGDNNQVLLGVTGSGKTFTMAKVIEKV